MGKEERTITQSLNLVPFNSFHLKAQNPVRKVLADTKKSAISQPRANHLIFMENRLRAIAN
ncbi:hypothetical protein [Nostoc sp. NZL]|uniref:hypothetical protein n=1 Tax=Nostoc sp. NZL TaxID=2650612 RepID=UPI001E4FEF4D|nr:hypothetical protein [Nostoc sp. NZL]MBG1242290.1 hypothetical protein [Nostoc sp. NZL]